MNMKKIIYLVFFAIFSFPVFGQSITDYFPVAKGNSWAYTNASGKVTEVITVKTSMNPQVGGYYLTFEYEIPEIGYTLTMYTIRDNKVHILAKTDIFGQSSENKSPYPVELAPAGLEWRYNDRGDDLRYKTSKSSCSFDGKAYNDCILVE